MTNISRIARLRKQAVTRSKLPRATLLARFFSLEATGGILLLIFTILSIAIANIPALSGVGDFFNRQFSIGIEGVFSLSMSLTHWVNDGLMVIFFFVVGMEIKREMLAGELASVKQATLPIVAAIGGMVVPAAIYALFNLSAAGEAPNGWGVPMATDIAFAIGIISLLGKRVPLSLKIFLTALAIVDDLGAIVVIAIFYPVHALHVEMLFLAAGIMLAVALLNTARIRSGIIYLIAGILLWVVVLKSGLHATIAGVLLAILIPTSTKRNPIRFSLRCSRLLKDFMGAHTKGSTLIENSEQKSIIYSLYSEMNLATSPLQRFEHTLHPWVMYIIMPLFALANAGVSIDSTALEGITSSVSLGVFFGLLIGKPLGIMLLCYIAVKAKVASLPKGTSWKHFPGIGLMAGIGFTMSIFISNLAFTNPALIGTAKFAILISSTCAGVLGAVVIRMTSKNGSFA